MLSSLQRPVEFTRELAAESVQRKAVQYDRDGDAHYDSISALIKSIRGSDPDAALYWLARMLEGGEDVRFLARRLVILASEDVGNADPAALPLAVAAAHACELVGLPECQLTLAQAVTYLACAPKSNAATVGIGEARNDVREGRLLPVPVHLRDSHYAGAKRLGQGQDYQYAHDAEGAIAAQDYLGVEREYYRPVDRGFEKELVERLEAIRAAACAGRGECRRTRKRGEGHILRCLVQYGCETPEYEVNRTLFESDWSFHLPRRPVPMRIAEGSIFRWLVIPYSPCPDCAGVPGRGRHPAAGRPGGSRGGAGRRGESKVLRRADGPAGHPAGLGSRRQSVRPTVPAPVRGPRPEPFLSAGGRGPQPLLGREAAAWASVSWRGCSCPC